MLGQSIGQEIDFRLSFKAYVFSKITLGALKRFTIREKIEVKLIL
jgi:hypothetical protein